MKVFELPEGYTEIKCINLKKNVKIAIILNIASLIIAAILVPIGLLVTPISLDIIFYNDIITENLFTSIFSSLFPLLILLLGMILYLIGHELIHGLFFKIYSGKKAKYGISWLYAYAKSDAYYNKREYAIIGLSPVVIFGLLFLLLNIFLPLQWFWFVYFLQMINLGGAIGDYYVMYIITKSPADILIYDMGYAMTFYSRKNY